jgi:hypothetical protein
VPAKAGDHAVGRALVLDLELLCTKQEDTPGWSVQMLKEPAVSPSHPVRPWCQTVAQRPVMPSSGCLRERGRDFGRADRGVGQDTPETGNQ